MNTFSKQSRLVLFVCFHTWSFFEMLDVPVYCNFFYGLSSNQPVIVLGQIKLAFCPVCSFITNVSFNTILLKYAQNYENSLHYSPRFQDYAQSLAGQLVNATICMIQTLLIGSGKGDFYYCSVNLATIEQWVWSQLRSPKDHSQVKSVSNLFKISTERYTDYQGIWFVVGTCWNIFTIPKICSTLTASHWRSTKYSDILWSPKCTAHFPHLAIWDILYEHCSYFTPVSLAHTFSSCGFSVCELTEQFDGQFLSLEALPTEGVVDETDEQLGKSSSSVTSPLCCQFPK